MTTMADDIVWTRQLAIRLGPQVKPSKRWQEMLKTILRCLAASATSAQCSPDLRAGLARAVVEEGRDDAEDHESEPLADAESHLVRSIKAVLDANDVPPDVAERVVRPIQQWEKAPTTKWWI